VDGADQVVTVGFTQGLPESVDGYAAGGDDYLVKPFEPQELLWRIRALMRRRAARPSHSPRQLGDLFLDPALQLVPQRPG
jgi:DNA-binding response OmpR family regulator